MYRGNLGPKTYLIFAGWMFVVTILTFFYLPETKGRSAAELDEMFEAGVPAREFKSESTHVSQVDRTNVFRLSVPKC